MPHEAADDSTVAHGGASVVAAPPLLPPLPASGSAACATAAAADPPSSSSSAAAAAASCCCWLLDVSRWRPAPGELEWLAEHAVVDAREAASALAHRQPLDRARAIAARLMARACSARALGLAWEEVRIERTRGRRPYCANGSGDATSGGADSSINNSISTNHTNRPPNFNFNAAHEGDFVALASDALCAVGVDVAAPRQLRRRPAGGGEAPGGIMASLRLVKDALTLREVRMEGNAPGGEIEGSEGKGAAPGERVPRILSASHHTQKRPTPLHPRAPHARSGRPSRRRSRPAARRRPRRPSSAAGPPRRRASRRQARASALRR